VTEATIAVLGATVTTLAVAVTARTNLRRRTAAVAAVGKPATTAALPIAVVARPGRTHGPRTETRAHATRSVTP
jgi:hypothetical protein